MTEQNVRDSVEIGVRNISMLGFKINELNFKQGGILDINISQETMFDGESSMGRFALTFDYVYKDSGEQLLQLKVATTFSISGLKDFIIKEGTDAGKIDLPRNALITCLSLSLSHSRVFLSQGIANTILNGVIPLSMFNPTELAKFFYPEGNL